MLVLPLGKLLHQWVDELLLDWSVLWCVGFVVLGLRRRTVPGLVRAVELRRMPRRPIPGHSGCNRSLLLQPMRGRYLPSLAGSLELLPLPGRYDLVRTRNQCVRELRLGPIPIVDWGDQLFCVQYWNFF